MDQDYRNNIAGSPYLEEGVGARLKSRAANAISAGQSVRGQRLDNPQNADARLTSLWNGFIIHLTKLLADVDKNVSPLIQNRQANKVDPDTGGISSPVTNEQKELLHTFRDLYSIIKPVSVQLARTSNPEQDPTKLNKKMDVFGGKFQSPNIYPPTSKLKEVIGESAWDALKRGVSKGGVALTKALVSRDPNKILNAYKKVIQDLYNTFIQDAAKVTGYSKDMIFKMIRGIYPPNKHRDILNKIEQVKEMPYIGSLQPAPVTTAP
jgi:hypothetical protein